MPTTHVESGADELLQTVADFLLKSRKIVVVTGAGISTNSGIPDFRSENGLYSLIQAQYDTAAKQLGKKGENESNDDENEAPLENDTHERDAKRQRDSQYVRIEAECESLEELSCKTQDEIRCANNRHVEEPELPSRDAVEDSPPTASEEQPVPNPQLFSTPKPNRMGPSEDQLDTSPLSSPPPDELIIPPSTFRLPRQQLVNVNFPLSSSPLSSPPPVLFDPFEPNSPSDASSGRRSSTSMSEVDETSPSSSQLLFTSSQTSNSGRNALPNMKGRDLFDASIWTDPLRTSVFYTFATSLRHKIKEAEPTGSHRFISHLRDRGKLVRCYTQNIDQIEEKVGLSTSLIDGPGSRGRFSRRSTANTNQLAKMVEEVAIAENGGSSSSEIPLLSQKSQSSSPDSSQMQQTEEGTSNDQAKNAVAQRDTARTGVECVFLHGSLQLLRCFLCARVCSWEDDDRELETLYGQQPECPHCAGATAARQERGKRALGVGKLRPDIVLYGEEHPNAHLISPIVTHDLALYPDMMLILGTSLRVHGLKIMVREFAKTVHSKGGKVVFVNFTKPPESSWGDTIDYWVEWDCDAWVADLKERIPKLWQEPEPKQPKKIRPPAANPVALRDTKVTGAYWTSKVLSELQRVTGKDESPRRATLSAPPSQVLVAPVETPLVEQVRKVVRPKPRRSRQSAPGALEKPKQQGSTLNPNHDRTRKSMGETTPNAGEIVILSSCDSSILDSVKANPRRRKRKMIDGEEVCIPKIGTKKGANKNESLQRRAYQLPPLRPQGQAFAREKPQPMEPSSPPSGPLATLSVNLRSAASNRQGQSSKMDLKFTLSSEVVKGLTWPLESPPAPEPAPQPRRSVPIVHPTVSILPHLGYFPLPKSGSYPLVNSIDALDGYRETMVMMANKTTAMSRSRSLSGNLRSWGSNWKCVKQ